MNSLVLRVKEATFLGFSIRCGLFFVLWYVVYELLILPDGRLDFWLSLNVVQISTGIVGLLGYDVVALGRIGGIVGAPGIELVDGCNGISAMGIFLGFMIAWPDDWKKKSLYSLIGILVLYFTNILRIVVLMITQVVWPSMFTFTHDYSTTTIFYIIIIGLWVLWTEKGSDWSFNTSAE